MKKLLAFLLSFIVIQSVSAQPSPNPAEYVQASIGVGTVANSFKIYVRSNINQSATSGPGGTPNNRASTVQYSLAIPNTTSPVPTLTITSQLLLTGYTVDGPYNENGLYTYNITTANVGPIDFTANVEREAMEVVFSGGPATFPPVYLITLFAPNFGDVSQNVYFYYTGDVFHNNDALYYARPGTTIVNQLGAIDPATATQPSYATTSGVVLPVSFTSFNVQKRANDALLNWTIENADLFTDHFDVERSTDGINFEKVGAVPYNAALNGAYSYIDPNVTILQKSIVYYRIKSVDVNGSFKLTEIKNLRFDKVKYNVSVFPNPATLNITLSLNADKALTTNLRIFDAAGQQVKNTQVKMQKGINLIPQDVSNLAAGTYQILLVLDGEKITVPFIKAN